MGMLLSVTKVNDMVIVESIGGGGHKTRLHQPAAAVCHSSLAAAICKALTVTCLTVQKDHVKRFTKGQPMHLDVTFDPHCQQAQCCLT